MYTLDDWAKLEYIFQIWHSWCSKIYWSRLSYGVILNHENKNYTATNLNGHYEGISKKPDNEAIIQLSNDIFNGLIKLFLPLWFLLGVCICNMFLNMSVVFTHLVQFRNNLIFIKNMPRFCLWITGSSLHGSNHQIHLKY